MNTIVTADLSGFGYRELSEAAELLKAYADNGADYLSSGITINFNANSGYVFLSDEDYNVAMMNGDKLEQWFYCSECGNEGFDGDYSFTEHEGYCSKECQDKNK